jgi:hypothetical protein
MTVAGWRRAGLALRIGAALFACGSIAAPCSALSDLEVVSAESIAPGVTLTEWRRGARGPSSGGFLLRAGVEKEQKAADRLLALVERAGFRPLPVYGKDGYEIRVPGFGNRAAAEAARDGLRAAGVEGAEVVEAAPDVSSPWGPLVARVLEVDPGSIDVVVAHARDAAMGLETTRDLARRHGALAAVNGGFFRTSGPLAGESEGVLVVDGRLLSEPDRGRAGVAFVLDADGRARALFDRLGFCAELELAEEEGESSAPIALDGIDRERRTGEVILYTPEFHLTTLTGSDGVEAIARQSIVSEIRRERGSSPIPADGVVLSFDAAAAESARLRPGMEFGIDTRLLPLAGDPARLWERASGALGAGPLLLAGGRRALDPARESISRVFTEARHPRTAVAARVDGSLLFVTVDGRAPDSSVGMTLAELTDFLLSLGASDAVNLDGGGSTTMVVRGETINRTSDPTGDRANGDAILLFPRGGSD